jgi:hypothetical protein
VFHSIRGKSFLSSGALLLALAIGLRAPSAVAQSQQADPGEPGTIEGVILSDAGKPLGCAHVWVREHGNMNSGLLHFVLTDAGGSFRFDHLRVGLYDIIVSGSGELAATSKVAKVVRLTEERPKQSVTVRGKSAPTANGCDGSSPVRTA